MDDQNIERSSLGQNNPYELGWRKYFGLFCSSRFVTLLNEFQAKTTRSTLMRRDAIIDDAVLQQASKEAQEKMGVPAETIHPVLEVDKNFAKDVGFAAYSVYGRIFIDSRAMRNSNSASAEGRALNRFTLLHEAAHVKFNDSTVLGVVGGAAAFISSGIGGIVTSRAASLAITPKPFRTRTAFFAAQVLVNFPISVYVADKTSNVWYRSFIERRADTYAACCMDCRRCVESVSKIKGEGPGYLSRQEMLELSKHIQEDGGCDDHYRFEFLYGFVHGFVQCILFFK